jgi:hypothetical protein
MGWTLASGWLERKIGRRGPVPILPDSTLQFAAAHRVGGAKRLASFCPSMQPGASLAPIFVADPTDGERAVVAVRCHKSAGSFFT